MTVIEAWNLKVYLEYGQFYLEPTRPYTSGPPDPMDDEGEILERAFAPGIAQGRYVTVVITPHRDNWDMDLQVELLDGPAEDDLAEWLDVFHATVDAGPDGIWYHTPTMDSAVLPIPPGKYRIRISGRGFLRPEWVDGDSIHFDDNYRFQFWPESRPIEPLRLKEWDHPETCGHI